jgi:hypothetical protein
VIYINFYFFNSDFSLIKKLEDSHFTGVLFTYHIRSNDYFTKIARSIHLTKKIKYMVAIRPYVISPQYLCMISNSINEMSENRLQINLISGHIKKTEEGIGGIIGDVTDSSSSIDRSNYLINFIKTLQGLSIKKPDFYVSVTNDFTFAAASEYNNKMIIGYGHYKEGRYDLTNKKVMISITPILRETEEELKTGLTDDNSNYQTDMSNFTYKEFKKIIDKIKSEQINEVILSSWNMEDTFNIIDFVKKYKENKI